MKYENLRKEEEKRKKKCVYVVGGGGGRTFENVPQVERRKTSLLESDESRGDVQNLQWTSPVPHHQDQTSPTFQPASAAPTVNSLALLPPEHSTEMVPFYPAPSGTGTLSPRMQWR